MQTKRLFVLIHIRNKGDGSNRQTCLSSQAFLLTVLNIFINRCDIYLDSSSIEER